MPSRRLKTPAGNSPAVARRSLLGALGAGALATAAAGTAVAAAPRAWGATARAASPHGRDENAAGVRTLHIGTFGGGIVTATYDTATGALTATGGFDAVTDPSFLALAPSGKVLYSLDTVGQEGGVRAFAVGADGSLTALGAAQSTGGAGVTHLALHPGGSHLLSANYDSGSVATHPVHQDGSLGARSALVQHHGSGRDPERQSGPHAHQIIPDPGGNFVFAVDLGTDSVYGYRLDTEDGQLRQVSEVTSAPGAGPRHMVFHPGGRFAYVANELDGTLTVCAYDAATGILTRGDSQSTLPPGTDPGTRNYPAEVVLSADSRFLYVSNRGHDSVSRFTVEEGGASLSVVDTVPSGGSYPRHLALSPSGTLLFTGNQKGNTVGVFTVDTETGALTPSGTPFPATSPVCVLPA